MSRSSLPIYTPDSHCISLLNSVLKYSQLLLKSFFYAPFLFFPYCFQSPPGQHLARKVSWLTMTELAVSIMTLYNAFPVNPCSCVSLIKLSLLELFTTLLQVPNIVPAVLGSETHAHYIDE